MKKIAMKKVLAMPVIALAIAGCTSDTLPDETGNSFGQLAFTGDAKVGETLTAAVTDGNGVDTSAISYNWMADGVSISGATSSSFTLTEAQAGSQVSVSISYIDNDDYQELLQSSSTSTVLTNAAGAIELAGTAESGKLLTATVADGNGLPAEGIVYSWMADGVAIDNASSSTLALTDNEIGKTITVSASYTDDDDYSETVTSAASAVVAGASANTPATFGGLTVKVANNVSSDVTGMIVVSDDDVGDNALEAQSATMTTFGTFSVAADGNWTYTLDTANATIASLTDLNDFVTDSIAVYSVDGTAAELVVTITGVSAVAATNVAKITDNMTDDAGELRYKFDAGIPQGKLTVSFLKEVAQTADGSAKDAYIGLYGESTSTSNAIIDLRIQESGYVIRDQDGIDVTIPFSPDVWTDVEMTWDASAASDSVAPLVTVTINGTSVTTEAFSSASSSLSDVMTGVRYVIFKLGDNGSTIPDGAYYVDDIKVYSDLDGTSVAFEDDFEGYSDGDSLDTDNADSPYNSSTAETFVHFIEGQGTPSTGSGNTTQVAKITDNMTDDAGELRYKFDAGIPQGKLTVSFLKEVAETADGSAKDAYIGLYGESTSTSNAIVDLRIQADKFVIRGKDDIDVTIPFTPGVWTDVEMTWDASAATDSVAPLVTITIDGTSVTTDAFSSASASLSDVMTGVRYAIFKLGDNGSTLPGAAYYVDDVKLYSDLDGTTVAFEDDFESYADGDSLDTDNADSPYNSSSAEVVVEALGDGSAPVNADNLVAQITDSMTDDAGELRYKLDAGVAQGKLTVSFYKDDKAETADAVAKDAYIGLFGESTSTSNAIVDLRIQADKFVIRDQDDIDVSVPFTPGVWTDVEMTWDASAATDSVAPLVTITIGGTSVTTDAFSSASSSLSDVMTGVRYVIFKLGDNGSTIPDAAYYVDDVKIYSDLDGTVVEFEDDFEGYAEGDSLDTDNADSPYNSNTAEAVVAKKAK